MNLSQDQLKAFFEIARLGSFTKAAKYLGLTQSALSHRIKNLEENLETSLFIRTPNSLQLTPSGDNLLKYIRVQNQIESEFISELKKISSNSLSGTLKVGGISTLMWSIVIPALSRFIRKNLSVRMEMHVKEVSELPNLLQSGQVDFIITCEKINRHPFEEIYLGDEVNVLVESKKFKKIPDIFLDHHPEDNTTFEYLKLFSDKKQKINRSFLDSIHGILSAVDSGLGRAVIPFHLVHHDNSIQIINKDKKLKIPIYLCYLKQPVYSKLHLSTLETLKKEIPLLLR